MDYIALRGLKFHSFHGVHAYEKKDGNDFVIDALFYSDLNAAGKSDNLNDTVDYVRAYEIIKSVMDGPSKDLMEALLEDMANILLAEFSEVNKIEITIRKKNPPVGGPCAASEVSRQWQNT